MKKKKSHFNKYFMSTYYPEHKDKPGIVLPILKKQKERE